MVQQTIVSVQAKQERPDDLLFGCITKPANHTVRGAPELHFLHARALPGHVRTIQAFGDDPIQISADFFEPLPGGFDVISRRGEANMIFGREKICREFLQAFPPLLQGIFDKRLPSPIHQYVESDEQSGMLRRELFNATGGRMNPLQELIEGEALSLWNDQFSVEHESVRL